MLTEHQMTEKLLKQLITEKKQELEKEIENNQIIKKLNTEIKSLEITLETLTKNEELPEEPKAKPHPLDRPSVDKKINFFHTQTKNFKIKKDYKNNQLSLWDKNNQLVNFSLFTTNLDENVIKNIDSWLDKTHRYSHYYNKLTKIFDKTNKEYFIVTTFDKQGDRIYVKYCHNSKTPNTKSVLHIKKKGKSYIETTKEIDCKKDYFEIPLKNNTSIQVSGYNNTDYDDFNLTVELKHIERHVKQNDLEKHFENIFNALKKQNHLG